MSISKKWFVPNVTVYMIHTEIHELAKRALPAKICLYKHAIIMYKLFIEIYCEDEFIQLKFQLSDNVRSTKVMFIKRQNFYVGNNILLNRTWNVTPLLGHFGGRVGIYGIL